VGHVLDSVTLDPVLDRAHALTLRAAAQGKVRDSPALRNLVAAGLVVEAAQSRGYELSPAGRAALVASTPSRLESWGVRITAAAVLVLPIGIVIGRVIG
jgi:hypothetical protein